MASTPALLFNILEILRQKMPLKLYTDTQTAWDAVKSLRATSKKRLLLDFFGLRESYRAREMSNISRIDTNVNPAVLMTKVCLSPCLLHALDRNCLDHAVAQEVAFGQIEWGLHIA